MPNQPATPARTFRLSDETVAMLDRATEALGFISRSEALRHLIAGSQEAAEKVAEWRRAVGSGIGEEVTAEIPLEAFAAAETAGWLNAHLEQGHADRTLALILKAAQPYIAQAERERVLRDAVERLRGFGADPRIIQHFDSLADAAGR